MNEKDAYATPDAAVSDLVDPANPIRWKRIAGWGVLIYTVVMSIYILGGIVDARLRFYGVTIEEIIASIASFVLYLVFLYATPRRHFLKLMCVFLVVQLFGIAVDGTIDLMLAFDDSFDGLISFTGLRRNLLVCLLADAAWYATARRSRSK